jgi:hypothetical protein
VRLQLKFLAFILILTSFSIASVTLIGANFLIREKASAINEKQNAEIHILSSTLKNQIKRGMDILKFAIGLRGMSSFSYRPLP